MAKKRNGNARANGRAAARAPTAARRPGRAGGGAVRGIIKSVRDVHVSRLVLPLAGWLLPGASDRA